MKSTMIGRSALMLLWLMVMMTNRAKADVLVQDAQDASNDLYLSSFRMLVEALSADQGDRPTAALKMCKQKLDKLKKVPVKELQQLLPDICAYIDKIRANSPAPSLVTINAMLTEVQQSLNTLSLEIDNQVASLTGDSASSGAGSDRFLILGIRQLIGALDAKLSGLITDVSQDQSARIEEISALLGSSDDVSSVVDSISDIDELQATVIQWLKTIARQLVALQGPCMESGNERCWPKDW